MNARERKLEFVALFVAEYGTQHGREACVKAAGELLRLAKRRQAVNLADCQGCPGIERIPYPRAGVMIEEWEERLTRRKAKLTERIDAACKPFGLEWFSGGDPRGAAVRVKFPSGASNMIGTRNQWAVPV